MSSSPTHSTSVPIASKLPISVMHCSGSMVISKGKVCFIDSPGGTTTTRYKVPLPMDPPILLVIPHPTLEEALAPIHINIHRWEKAAEKFKAWYGPDQKHAHKGYPGLPA
ncbi:hypothetical protein BJV74DRAFT_888108 [Russula compacta]|nr:hypothetical protein BJV74DRAFT_888108 [Russula compacta]